MTWKQLVLRISSVILVSGILFFGANMGSGSVSADEMQYREQRQQYLDLFVAYRQTDEQFLIAQQQYRQLQTLASLEKAVQTSREMQILRSRMMTAYFQTQLLLLQDTQGGELTQKGLLIERLETMIASLQALTVELDSISDRIQADEYSSRFDAQQQSMESLANQVTVFIKLSRVQALNDQVGLAGKQVMDTLLESELSSVRLSEKQRGYDELARNITTSKDRLATVLQNYTRDQDRNIFAASAVNQYTTELSSIYTQINRSITFVKELAR